MHLISTRVHGVLDYLVSALLIASPWLFDFAFGEAETWVPVCVGLASIAYSLMTSYELGLARLISMPMHLRLDFLASAFVLTSPWLFAFSPVVQLPHVAFGLLGLVIVGFSRPMPSFGDEREAGTPTGHAGHA